MTVDLRLERTLLLILTLILSFLGLFFVFESSALESFKIDGSAFYFLKNQSFAFLVGLGSLIAARFVPVKLYLRFPYFFYFLALFVSLLCFFPGFGTILVGNVETFGAKRWIWLFGFSIQVAEIVKFCVIVFFAYLLKKTQDLKVFLFYLTPPVLMLLWQRDLGSMLVVLAIALALYFLSGVELKKITQLVGLGLLAVILMIVLVPYRRERLLTFFQPGDDRQDSGYHVHQLKIGVGRGGLFGQGIGNSRQKFAYIPLASSDSIFAIISEEIGFLGVSFLFFFFFFFLYLIWRLVSLADLSQEEKLVGYGIFALFSSQIFINLAAISGTVPLTGITLPFFSAGGSSLVISLFLVGVVLSLSVPHNQVTIKRRKKYV